MKKDFVVVRGSIRTDGGFKGPGSVLSLEESEAKKMDPQGIALEPKEKNEAKKRAEVAAAAELAKLEKGGK